MSQTDEYFVFQCDRVDPADVIAIATTVMRALAAYGTAALKEMIQNCMAQDLSWKVSTMMTAEFVICRPFNLQLHEKSFDGDVWFP